jgi:hypothetical protein
MILSQLNNVTHAEKVITQIPNRHTRQLKLPYCKSVQLSTWPCANKLRQLQQTPSHPLLVWVDRGHGTMKYSGHIDQLVADLLTGHALQGWALWPVLPLRL